MIAAAAMFAPMQLLRSNPNSRPIPPAPVTRIFQTYSCALLHFKSNTQNPFHTPAHPASHKNAPVSLPCAIAHPLVCSTWFARPGSIDLFSPFSRAGQDGDIFRLIFLPVKNSNVTLTEVDYFCKTILAGAVCVHPPCILPDFNLSAIFDQRWLFGPKSLQWNYF